MLNKTPEVTITFWVMTIMSMAVGETGADFLAMHMGLGTGVAGGITVGLLIVTLLMQFRSWRYVPWRYWLTVNLVSVVGTQITDVVTDGWNISPYVSTTAFTLLLVATFAIWYFRDGTLSIYAITTRRRELFYWTTILFTFTLGTAGGDLATDALDLGFNVGVLVFGALGLVIAGAYYLGANTLLTFWTAYILTRPLGASLGDLLSQSQLNGGVGVGTVQTCVIFLVIIAALVTLLSIAQFGPGMPSGTTDE
jgi:uncharacterized membrane-anchored protein